MCYQNDKRKEDKIGGVCWKPWGRRKIHTGSLWRNQRDRKQLGNLRLDERIILTQTLKKQNGTGRTGCSYSGLGQLSCSYKRGCNYLGYIKSGEFLKQKNIRQLLKENVHGVSQPANQPASQPVSQSVTQLVNQQ